MSNNNIVYNLEKVRQKISTFAMRYGRTLEEICLLAVSKNKSISVIEEAIAAGHYAFGENYVQEGVNKIRYFIKQGNINLQWHFIGSLQANKSRLVAEYFNWCHTIDCIRIARRLSVQRPTFMPPLNVLIQINISNENSKSGISIKELDLLAAKIAIMPRLIMRGLMAIPAPELNYEKQFAVALQIASVFKKLKARYSTVDTLSLGMSDDMESAIAAGSTMVRIGTAIFGMRDRI